MDPYQELKRRPSSRKSEVRARIVTVFGNKREDRGLRLMATYTRALCQNEIHEFIITNERGVRPGCTVDAVGYVCFGEIERGGVAMFGDKVVAKDRVVGEIVGFNETHMPNHLNIVMEADNLRSGFELGLNVGDQIVIAGRI